MKNVTEFDKCLRCEKPHHWDANQFESGGKSVIEKIVNVFCEDCVNDYMDSKIDGPEMNGIINKASHWFKGNS